LIGGFNELVYGCDSIVREVIVVREGIEARARPTEVVVAWWQECVVAGDVDVLSICIETG